MTDYREPHKFEPSGKLDTVSRGELCKCGLPESIPVMHSIESKSDKQDYKEKNRLVDLIYSLRTIDGLRGKLIERDEVLKIIKN